MKQLLTLVIISVTLLICMPSSAQQSKLDALFAGADTSAVMDSLMKDFDAYLDSVTQRKNFVSVSIGVGTGLFSFKNSSSFDYTAKRQLMLSPEVSYYHRTGLALTLTGYLVKNANSLSSYQYAISPSYQFLSNRKITAGVSFTRFLTSKKVDFYTTPIQNEFYAYAYWKNWWLEPGISASYGWGSKTDYQESDVEATRAKMAAAKHDVINIQTDQSVKDLSVLFSVRHRFSWEKVISKVDMLSITPALLLSAGTQNFGFNTSFSSNSNCITNSFLPANIRFSDSRGMNFQSTTVALQMNYTTPQFYVMPQVLLDYYLHSSPQRFNSVYSVTVGHNF